MPATTERFCNLTLTRNEWAVLVRLLDTINSDMSRSVRQCIRAALNADTESAEVSIDRECEKWAGVLGAVYEEARRRRGEYSATTYKMTVQISAAQFTGDW